MRIKLKSLLKLIDGYLLFSFFKRFKTHLFKRQLRSTLESIGGRSFSVYTSNDTVVGHLCDKHGTDKGTNGLNEYPYAWAPHRYSDFYDVLFRHRRSEIKRVFECGIGTGNLAISANMGRGARPGASLRVWREYFPNALIYGADIDPEILFSEDRIWTLLIDQLDEESIRIALNNFEPGTFELIIDDGLHTFQASATLFRNSNHLLSDRGVYIIEDVTPANLRKLLSLRSEFFSYEFSPVIFREVNRTQELNSLLMITKKSLGTY
jgi:hypothetical protein